MGIRKHHTFMVRFTGSLLKALWRPVLVYLLTLSFTVIFLCSVGIYYLERDVNEKIQTLFDAAYYSVTVMTGVGLGDLAPVTVAGRILSMAMMLLGTAIFVSFTAVVSAAILEIEMNQDEQKS
jgi:voltage-gated potassium channel